MGVSLTDPDGVVRIAVRLDPSRATALAGFDPVAVAVTNRAALEAWAQRLDDLGEPHSPIDSGAIGWLIAGLFTPDGIELRLYTEETR
jgi:hypothetical protein